MLHKPTKLTFKHFTSDQCPDLSGRATPTPHRRIASQLHAEPFLRHKRRLRSVTHFGPKNDAEETLAHHVEQSQVLGPDFPLVGRLGRRIEQGQGHRRTIVGQLHSFFCRR